MRGLRSRDWRLTVAILCLLGASACGGHKPPGASPYAARVNLNPAGSYSVQLGTYFGFTASANNSSNGGVNTTFTYTSSDTSILNIAPNGVACAGHWDAAFATCTPGNIGMVQVTATAGAQGATSQPTYVFVHQPIDNIVVQGILPTNLPIQEPCLSQSQTMTVQAYAYNQGNDITSSVGPFTWSANNASVVRLVPIITPFIYNNQKFYLATNQATATAVTPGITQIYATASNVFSTTFQQPSEGKDPQSVILDFFETCPIQNITLELGPVGSQQNGQTSFITPKGTTQTVTPILTDVMGNSSLFNPNSQIVLSKIPLTWTASQPGVVAVSSGCTSASCIVTTPSPGAGTVTASCSPPSCNVGFPEVPPALTPASLAACALYVQGLPFGLKSCEQFIPLPVYATIPITGIVTGAPGAATAVASSLDCQNEPSNPPICTTSIYSVSTSRASAGNATLMPSSPNSLLFDLAGDRAYIGSNFGALALNVANLNSANQAFTSLGAVEGSVLAVSPNGTSAIFTNPGLNEVFIAGTGAPIVLTIFNASTAAFSPDGLKAFIFGFDTNQNPTLYIYSTLQALQSIQLPANTTVSSIAFSDNGAFAYVAQPNLGSVGGPAVTVYNTCNNQVATGINNLNQVIPQIVPLSAPPIAFKALQDGVHFVSLGGDGNVDYITAAVTGIPAATVGNPAASICPMTVLNTTQTLNLQLGSVHPINIFASGDGSQLYVVASDRGSILVYNFLTGAVHGILLNGDITPLSADITVDSGTIMVAGSDGQLHEVSTANSGNDQVDILFPPLANYLNPFCTFEPSGPCKFDLMAVRP